MKEMNGIDIEIQPIHKIVTFECNKFTKEEFFKRISLVVRSRQSVQLNWAEGIVFVITPYQPNSDVVIKEALKGTVYWSNVIFAKMEKYEPVLKFGAFEIPLFDQSTNSILKEVALWLKERLLS